MIHEGTEGCSLSTLKLCNYLLFTETLLLFCLSKQRVFIVLVIDHCDFGYIKCASGMKWVSNTFCNVFPSLSKK